LDDSVRLRLAMAQMRVEWGAPGSNLAHACDLVAEGAAQGCELVLLPECLDIGWTHPDTCALAEPVPGPRSRMLAAAAQRHAVWVVAGLTEATPGATYNCAVMISPEGELVLKHRKINVLEIAMPWYAVGDRLGVAQTPWGRVGVDICADNFANSLVLGRSLGRMGARCILSPCAWAVDADHDNEADPYGEPWRASYSDLAREFDMPVVGVSNVGWIGGGPWQGRKCIGCSLAVARTGEVITWGPYGADAEAVTAIELELTPAAALGTVLAQRLCEAGRGRDGAPQRRPSP